MRVSRSFRRVGAVVGTLLVGAVLLMALVGALATPFDPILIDARARLLGPSAAHWLGTDEWGRDVASRVLAGAVTSVSVALATAAIATAAGALVGATAGYLGGWTDRIVLAVADALLAFPALILALGTVALVSASASAVVLALSVAYAPSVTRVVRSAVVAMKERDFVTASRVMGNGQLYTMLRHILPNTVGTVIVLATSLFGWSVLAESSLSFLGLGVPPPAPSWGGMLADSRNYFEQAPWLALAPGIAISGALLGVNLLGDALRDHFDPKTRDL